MWKYLEKISKKSITFMLIAPTNILLKPNSRRTNGYGYQQHSLDFSYCPPPPVRPSVHVCAFSDSREMKWRKLWRSVHGRRCCVPRTNPPPSTRIVILVSQYTLGVYFNFLPDSIVFLILFTKIFRYFTLHCHYHYPQNHLHSLQCRISY